MVNFVIGPGCTGKSEFIKSTFPDAVVIDLWDYQKDNRCFNVDNISESYIQTQEALEHALKENPGKQIVLEHTMLKAARRAPYIESVRSITQEPLNCYVMVPDLDTYKAFCKKRKIFAGTMEFRLLEIPTKKEGFDNIYIIKQKY